MKYSAANSLTFVGVLSKLPVFCRVVVTFSIDIEVWGVPNVYQTALNDSRCPPDSLRLKTNIFCNHYSYLLQTL